MALSNLATVSEYRRTVTEAGTSIIQMTGENIDVIPANITRIYTAGIGYEEDGVTDHNIFTVRLLDGSKFITDWAGVSTINGYTEFVRVNEYKTVRTAGVSQLKYTDHGMRVVVKNITKIYTAGAGLNDILIVDCYTVYLKDGSKFITDAAGKTLIGDLGA